MKQEKYVALIHEGVRVWNSWRANHPKEFPILDGIELDGLNLESIDFSGLSLQNAKICNCKLKNAKFISANLRKSELQENDFSSAKFIAASLGNADLTGSKFQGANLLTASVRGAILDEIDFRGHDLRSLDLRETSLSRCNLEGQVLANFDLTGINLERSNLRNADLSFSNLADANLYNTDLYGAKLNGVNFKKANLSGVNFRGKDLEGLDFKDANLEDCDFREANLTKACLAGCNFTGVKLWKVRTNKWDISRISCKFAYWNKTGDEKTVYHKHEFERIYSEASTIELNYPYRLTTSEIVTLPIFIEHLEATFWGCSLRLKNIKDIAGGALVSIRVEETGRFHPSELKNDLQQEANRIQQAQLTLRTNRDMQTDLKEDIAAIREKFWPRLLELAAENERENVRNLTVVFMDLKGFSKWKEDELSEKLALFRGLIKPILDKWQGGHPNMEGDSLRVTFRNATIGLACACMIRGVLTGAGFEVRVGVELGEVAVVHNEVTNISDLEGTAVSMAARLEAVAQPGQVVVTERVRHYTDYKGIFSFTPTKATLAKSIGKMQAGQVIECYAVDVLIPIQEIG